MSQQIYVPSMPTHPVSGKTTASWHLLLGQCESASRRASASWRCAHSKQQYSPTQSSAQSIQPFHIHHYAISWKHSHIISITMPNQQYIPFLANVNDARPSVCLSSVMLVRPPQAVQIFRNISTAFGTLAILWHPRKILWRLSQGNPSFELNPRGVAKYSDSEPIEGYISETVQDRR